MGLMDADVYGPSLPLLTGVTGRLRTQDKRIFPHEGNGLKLMSIGFLVTDDSLLSCLGQAMHEIAVSEFQYTIQETHGSRSQLIERVSVVETFEGDTVWEGEVLVFDLLDHPTAQYCYAWEVDGQVTAVLHTGPVDSPLAAVRASILAEE